MIDFLIPGLAMMLGSILVAVTAGILRKAVVLTLPLITLALIWFYPGAAVSLEFMGYGITPLLMSPLGKLFASTFAVMAFAGMLYALNYASRTELIAASLYAGCAIGISLAGDFITLFVCWELMAIASMLIIFAAGTPQSGNAGLRYAIIHILGGMFLLYGLIGIVSTSGDASLRPLELDGPYAWAILVGFLINAGAPPLSAWVADAYPEASPSGSVFLSAFTTKSAVFALLSVFPGADVLIPIGIYMIFYGIVYALLENDMRRILAYSIVNQVGFMVTACGIGTALAINAAAAHASAHIIYKGLLMMSAGNVLLMTGKRKCTDLGGLYSAMKVTMLCAVVGAASISAVPFTSGFAAKSLVSESAAVANMEWVWVALLAASAGVFLHAGVKFPWFVFFNKKATAADVIEAPPNMQWAMILLVVICILVGVMPTTFYALLPYPVEYTLYTFPHLIEQMQLLLLSMFAFFILLPWLRRTTTISIDLDWFYRALPAHLLRVFAPTGTRLYHRIRRSLQQCLCAILSVSGFRSPVADVPKLAFLIGTFAVGLLVLLLVYY